MLCLRPRTDGFSDPQEILKDLWLLPIPFFFFFLNHPIFSKLLRLNLKSPLFTLTF